MALDSWQVLSHSSETVAPRLLGCILERELDGSLLRVRIVETEAYAQTDPASHSYKGRTPRTDVMFGPAGYAYVYFTYGMHYCMNIVCGPVGSGEAVLIRAVEPLEGASFMEAYRHGKTGLELTNGPAKLCQALMIDRSFNGHDLREAPCKLLLQPPLQQTQIIQTPRIGIRKAQDVPWRFYERANPYVSRL